MIWNHHEATQLLCMLGRHSPDAIWMVSPDWTEVKFVGDAYTDIYNQPIPSPEDEAVAFLQSIHPDDRDKVEDVFEALSNEQSVDIEYRTNPAEGSQRHVWMKAEPIYSDSGDFVAIGGFSRDFTQRKKT